MPRIAVDVVLLPSDEVAAAAIKANRELLRQYPGEIVLDGESCLPHISLAMGCIDSTDIALIEGIIQELTAKHNPGTLISIGIRISTNSAGEKVSVLALERTRTLQKLHEEVMHALEPYFSHDARAEMVLSPPAAGKSTLRWIEDYPEKSSFRRFFPHITLGYGQLDDFPFPDEFAAPVLALCHLGDHCTCRRILASAKFDC
jgi:2'-5' RNA ligase